MSEKYLKVEINGKEENLPKTKGVYMICNRQSFYMQTRFNPKLKESIQVWLKEVIWYEFPLTDAEITDRPEIVCICGSDRFLKEMHEVEERLTLEGKIVLMIGVNTKDVARTEDLSKYKPMLDELHLRKIDMANKVFVVNVGGYIGESTRKEIAYSESKVKPIEYLENI